MKLYVISLLQAQDTPAKRVNTKIKTVRVLSVNYERAGTTGTAYLDCVPVAAFLWKRMSETDFPITAATASPVLDESQDVQAALEAAGGGTGAHVDIV